MVWCVPQPPRSSRLFMLERGGNRVVTRRACHGGLPCALGLWVTGGPHKPEMDTAATHLTVEYRRVAIEMRDIAAANLVLQ